nr:type I restriction enzyme endonuclease domain-containing protein [Chloroflexus islandicus]
MNTVRNNVTLDWTLRATARAHLRRMVKRVLRRYGYPPDKQEWVPQTVLEQAEALSLKWVARAGVRLLRLTYYERAT